MKKLYMFLIAIICASIFSCAKKEAPKKENEKITVVATIFPPYDFVRAVAGDNVNLSMLLPPAAESHSFEPTPKDIIAAQNSDLFVYIGGESEVWVDRILESSKMEKTRVLALIDTVNALEEEIVEGMEEEEEEEASEGAEEEAEYDEHIWTSVRNAKIMAASILGALCEIDEANASEYKENFALFASSLDALDGEFSQTVGKAKYKTIIFGDRFPFRYFAEDYGLSYFAAFPGCSTETEPSASTVAFLIDKVKAENLPVVFHIELSNEKMADAITEATGAKKLLLHSAHNISKSDFEKGRTYLEIMQDNVENIKIALAAD
ncbi:MAG: metal ABC transporter substrate-binding protein [Spirochaetaceae bacterium]|jgi:zinc transport system substrate-binding protein|nr:metal ABC transporter substrate-binding protein [Spirochaetaceae bacterium]